eukprot:m.10498 g.10498  ORF g.10498 m.10498 type:complete len:119 (+) comp7057_c0_seq1:631-987(+)
MQLSEVFSSRKFSIRVFGVHGVWCVDDACEVHGCLDGLGAILHKPMPGAGLGSPLPQVREESNAGKRLMVCSGRPSEAGQRVPHHAQLLNAHGAVLVSSFRTPTLRGDVRWLPVRHDL